MKLKNLLLYGLIFLFIASCGKKEEEVIKIGVIVPLTGEAAFLGKYIVNGIEIAKNEFEETYSENKIDLIIEDSKADPKTAVDAINKLINVDKVKFIIGDATSGATLAIAPIAEINQVLLISPSASNPKLTEAGDYIFRVWQSDNYDGVVAANFCFDSLQLKKMGLFYINNEYGLGLANAFEEKFIGLGGSILVEDSYTGNATNFKSIIQKMKIEKVNGVYLAGHLVGNANFIRQSKELSFNPQFFSNVTNLGPDFSRIVGNSANGLLITAPTFNITSDDSLTKSFVESYKMRFDSDPDVTAAKGYEAIMIIFAGISSGMVTSQEMKDFIYKKRLFKGVTGNLLFDSNGDVSSDVFIMRYSDKEFEFYSRIIL